MLIIVPEVIISASLKSPKVISLTHGRELAPTEYDPQIDLYGC